MKYKLKTQQCQLSLITQIPCNKRNTLIKEFRSVRWEKSGILSFTSFTPTLDKRFVNADGNAHFMQPVSHDDHNATTFLRSSSVVNKTGCFQQIFIHKSVRFTPTMHFSFIFHVLHPESRASGAGAGRREESLRP